MQFDQDELSLLIEILGKDYKHKRNRITTPTLPAAEKLQLEGTVTTLDTILKKFLEYRAANFPEQADTCDDPSHEAEDEADQDRDFSAFEVLLVDDDASERRKIRNLLEDQGFESMEECDDGHTAIARIKDKATPFDLVLCDITMPTISGLDLLRLVRQDDVRGDTPFILTSSKGNKNLLQQAKEAGVNGYLVKPLSVESLRLSLDRVL